MVDPGLGIKLRYVGCLVPMLFLRYYSHNVMVLSGLVTQG